MAKYGSNEPIDVVVCNFSSPSSFHVYIRKFQNELLVFQKSLHKSYACCSTEKFPSSPPVNSVCVAYNERDKTYYRARVTSSDHSNGRLQVQFVDYGKDKLVHLNNLRTIKPEFLKFPFQAVHCCLDNIKSLTYKNGWSLVENNKFGEVVQGQRLHIDFKSSHLYFNSPNKVSLVIHKNCQKLDLAEFLIKQGIATSFIKQESFQCEKKVLAKASTLCSRTTQNLKKEVNTLKDTEYTSLSQKHRSDGEVTNMQNNVIIRVLVPRHSKRSIYGPEESVIQNVTIARLGRTVLWFSRRSRLNLFTTFGVRRVA